MKPARIKSQNGSQNDNIAGCNCASPHVKEFQTVLDSGSEPWIPALCHWNFDSGFPSLVGFRIPQAVFRIPKPKIPAFTTKISRIQESGFPSIGRSAVKFTSYQQIRLIKVAAWVSGQIGASNSQFWKCGAKVPI